MPFRSKAQMRLFAAKMHRGEITRATFDEWAAATDMSHLPGRVRVKAKAKRRGMRVKRQ